MSFFFSVTAAVRTFSANTNTLTRLVGSMGSGNVREDEATRLRVHELIAQNKKLAKDTNASLKRLTTLKSADSR